MSPADRARELAIPIELKKHGLRQQQSGEWVISFTVHPSDMAVAISLAPMGTRYQAALVELSDDGTAKEVMPDTHGIRTIHTADTAPVRVEAPARAYKDGTFLEWAKAQKPGQFEAEPPKRRLEQPRTPCKFDEMLPAAQAGMLANDASFQRYLAEMMNRENGIAADEAAEYIRNRCGVASRRDIASFNAAGKAWLDIVKQYRVWQLAPRVGAA